MPEQKNREMMRSIAGFIALTGLSLVLAGCGSSNLLSGSSLDFFNTSPKASAGEAEAANETNVECPEMRVRTGAATLMIGNRPNDGEPTALDLRYQVTIIRTARECRVAAGVMTMRVGIEGRVITGPAGGAGSVTVPIRLAVVQE